MFEKDDPDLGPVTETQPTDNVVPSPPVAEPQTPDTPIGGPIPPGSDPVPSFIPDPTLSTVPDVPTSDPILVPDVPQAPTPDPIEETSTMPDETPVPVEAPVSAEVTPYSPPAAPETSTLATGLIPSERIRMRTYLEEMHRRTTVAHDRIMSAIATRAAFMENVATKLEDENTELSNYHKRLGS